MSEGPIAPRLIVPSRIKRDSRSVRAASCARISCEHCAARNSRSTDVSAKQTSPRA